MKTTARDKRRRRLGAIALLCALLASLAVAVAPAAAEESDTAPLREMSEGGFNFPEITGPEAPERYPLQITLGEELVLEQLSPTEAGVFYSSGHVLSFTMTAEKAHDAIGTNVPTTLEVTAPDVVTLFVHYRAGNPAAAGAPFDYPIMGGEGWEGGIRPITVPLTEPHVETPQPIATPSCKVPALRGLSLRAAKARLRADHCAIGKIDLAHGATAAKGKVMKQFRVAGADLPSGATVAVKLGAR